VNLRNYLTESELNKINEIIDEIKAVILYIDDCFNQAELNSSILLNKLEEKVK
jgi:hypothetical protein